MQAKCKICGKLTDGLDHCEECGSLHTSKPKSVGKVYPYLAGGEINNLGVNDDRPRNSKV